MKNNKLFAALTAVTLVFGAAAFLPANGTLFDTAITASAAVENGFGYYIRKDGTAYITSYQGPADAEVIEIPATLGGKQVTVIGDYVLNGLKNVTEIKLPEGVTTLKIGCFSGCDKLVTVNIPSTVTTIEASVFSYNDSLKKVEIPDSVTEFGDHVFNICFELEEVKLSAGMTEIPPSTFEDCYRLQKVEIPESVVKIDKRAFESCGALKDIYIPADTEIADYAVGFMYIPDKDQHMYYEPIQGVTMHVYKNSPAEEYAKKFGINYIAEKEREIKGDINGDGKVNSADITTAAAFIKGKKKPGDEEKRRADVNGDGRINSADITKIAAHIKGLKKL